MDRSELKKRLIHFEKKCADNGKPLDELCIEEAFPGDNSTSYILKIKAPWVDKMYCSEALDFLFDTLWDTSDESIREKIFSIHILDSTDDIHCSQQTKEVEK